jgi:hypothetical protein
MIARMWRTRVQLSDANDFLEWERARAKPLYADSQGCVGALFMRNGGYVHCMSLWNNAHSLESASGELEIMERELAASGSLFGDAEVKVFSVSDGFLDPFIRMMPEGPTKEMVASA